MGPGSAALGIGRHLSGIADPFNGHIDEFRIAHVQPSDGWIETTWNNLSDPAPSRWQGPKSRKAGMASRHRWHALVRSSASWGEHVGDGQQVRQYVDGLRTNTVAVTTTGSWTIYKWGWQFFSSEALDRPAFGVAWDDAMVARWSANPLGMLWPEMDAAFVTSNGNGSGGHDAG